jgi:hypothetical protein
MHKYLYLLYGKVPYRANAKKGTQTLKEHKKIRVSDELYNAIKQKAAQSSQTVDQYAEYLLEKALTKGENADRSH